MKLKKVSLFFAISVFSIVSLVNCANLETARIEQTKPLTTEKGVKFFPKKGKKNVVLSSKTTGEWEMTFAKNEKLKVVFKPELAYDTSNNYGLYESEQDHRNYKKLPTISAQKLYLSYMNFFFNLPFEVGAGINILTKDRNRQDFINNPNNNQPWKTVDLDVSPKSVLATWLNLYLSDSIKWNLKLSKHSLSTIPADKNNILYPEHLKGVLSVAPKDNFKLNFETTFTWKNDFLNIDLIFSRYYSPWPMDGNKDSLIFQPKSFKFLSFGSNIEIILKKWKISVKPNIRINDLTDNTFYLVTSIEKEFEIEKEKKIHLEISNFFVNSLKHKKDTTGQRWWDIRRSWGNSFALHGKYIFFPKKFVKKISVGLNLNGNFEENLYEFIPELEVDINKQLSVRGNIYLFLDRKKSTFDNCKDKARGAIFFKYTFDTSKFFKKRKNKKRD